MSACACNGLGASTANSRENHSINSVCPGIHQNPGVWAPAKLLDAYAVGVRHCGSPGARAKRLCHRFPAPWLHSLAALYKPIARLSLTVSIVLAFVNLESTSGGSQSLFALHSAEDCRRRCDPSATLLWPDFHTYLFRSSTPWANLHSLSMQSLLVPIEWF